MLRCSLRTLFSAAAVALLLVGCATAPETGRKQLLLVSPADEARLGIQAFQKLKQDEPVVSSGPEAELVRKVGGRIARVAKLPHAQWEFVLFDDESPNAFALPGGKVGIYTGILPITKNEAGLATVVSHEVAHAVARHGAERMSQGLAVQIGGALLGAAIGTEATATKDMVMQAYGLGAQLGVMLPYSRTHELEADELGLLYMARAGYDPAEAIAFWKRFAAYNAKQGRGAPEFLSTHPLDARRIAELERLLPRAQAEYRRAGGAG
jgi:predicted Zn-dependent protease